MLLQGPSQPASKVIPPIRISWSERLWGWEIPLEVDCQGACGICKCGDTIKVLKELNHLAGCCQAQTIANRLRI